MKEYVKPKIKDIECNLTDVIATSFGDNQAGDKVVELFGGK